MHVVSSHGGWNLRLPSYKVLKLIFAINEQHDDAELWIPSKPALICLFLHYLTRIKIKNYIEFYGIYILVYSNVFYIIYLSFNRILAHCDH